MKGLNFSLIPSRSKENTNLLAETPTDYDVRTFSNDLPQIEINGEKSPTWNTTRKVSSLFQGWRYGIAVCCVLAAVIFIINIAILAWAENNFNGDGHGTINVFGGNCGHARNLSLGLHLGINILSSLLLGASNYCMQCLTSPTREAIDNAHGRKKWLSIGV